jgi:hypothetical protein
MVIITNRWSPDTCGCELEYKWDNEQTEDTRVHNFARIVKACDAHKTIVSDIVVAPDGGGLGLPGEVLEGGAIENGGAISGSETPTPTDTALQSVYDTVLEENQRKNEALRNVLEVRPELADIVDGTTGKRYDLLTVAKQMKMEDNPNKAAQLLKTGTTLKEGITYNWRWVEPRVTRGSKKRRTLEIDFEVPVTVEAVIAAKSASPDSTPEQIQKTAKQQIVGEPDKLQQVLDKAFTTQKGRGKVKVKQ